MLKKLLVRAVFGGDVPPIIRELQALEAKASREGWARSSRRQFASDVLLCGVAVLAVVAAMVGAFMAGMFESFGRVLIAEFMSGRFILVALVMVVTVLGADRCGQGLGGQRWLVGAMSFCTACSAAYLLFVFAAMASVLICAGGSLVAAATLLHSVGHT